MVSEDLTEEEGSELEVRSALVSRWEGPGSPVLGPPELLSQTVIKWYTDECPILDGS